MKPAIFDKGTKRYIKIQKVMIPKRYQKDIDISKSFIYISSPVEQFI